VTGWLVRWRLALRIARRDARRHTGRTLLVLAMVGFPVLAIVGADTLYRTNEVSPVEALGSTLGAADTQISGVARGQVRADPATGEVWQQDVPRAEPPWTHAEVARALPNGSRVIEAVSGQLTYRTELGNARVAGLAADLGDPLRHGVADLLDGRLPRSDGEIAISARLAERGIGLGDDLALIGDDAPAEVVGILRSPEETGGLIALPSGGADLLSGPRSTYYASVPGGLDWPAVRELNELGLVAVSREVVEDPPAESQWLPPDSMAVGSSGNAAETAVLALIVTALVVEVVLLAGPAFAVGVRRQRRDLALVAATGGTPGDLRRIVLASGVLLGGGAAMAGAALGVALAAAAVPVIESRSDILFGPFDVPVLDALLTVLVGAGAGLAAAHLPARQAARTDVVDALAGRRGHVRTTWRLPAVGLLLASAGMALVVLGAQGTELGVAAGAVLLVAGVVAAVPWLIGLLAPLGRVLPVSGRLAVRDATRNRGRTAPAVAAVMATVAGVTALAVGSASDSAQSRRDYVAQAPMGTAVISGDLGEREWATAEGVLREQAPDRAVHRLRGLPYWTPDGTQPDLAVVATGCTGGPDRCRWHPEEAAHLTAMRGDLVVADSATLRALDRGVLGEEAYRALDAGLVVVLGDGAVDEQGSVTFVAQEYDGVDTWTELARLDLPAVEVPVPAGERVMVTSLVVVPPVLADRLPVAVTTSVLLAGGPDDPVTPGQEAELAERLGQLSMAQTLYVERGWRDELDLARWLLLGVGGLLVLVATLTATGLALADARPDFATLAVVGAAPRTRRFVAMGSAAVVSGGGALIGVLVGLAPGIAVAYPLTSTDYGFGAHPVVDIPWLLLTGLVVLVPLLAVAVTGLSVRSRLPLVRRAG
jgi:putative ABC transport system permease protein